MIKKAKRKTEERNKNVGDSLSSRFFFRGKHTYLITIPPQPLSTTITTNIPIISQPYHNQILLRNFIYSNLFGSPSSFPDLNTNHKRTYLQPLRSRHIQWSSSSPQSSREIHHREWCRYRECHGNSCSERMPKWQKEQNKKGTNKVHERATQNYCHCREYHERKEQMREDTTRTVKTMKVVLWDEKRKSNATKNS